MPAAAEESPDVDDEVIVTGSRLRRDTYTSIAPLQVITGQVSREVGLIDATDILQESTASSGQQIDLTFTGFVLDNGPGATTIDLRGLGANRTLVLIDGKRGMPINPTMVIDTNSIPRSAIARVEVITGGASAVYGADAVGGDVNFILKDDFEGASIDIRYG
ncbi:MAG: TonB-dependent receptor plug domain-containing protein, partial [Planctomycetaceae bacterium]